MPAGRPTKYNDGIITKIRQYVDECSAQHDKIPTKEEFARLIGINTDTVVEWIKEKPEFSVAIKDLEQLQRDRLIRNGLVGKYNPTMSIFLLKANHGMIETEKRILAGDKDSPIEPLIVIKHDNKPE